MSLLLSVLLGQSPPDPNRLAIGPKGTRSVAVGAITSLATGRTVGVRRGRAGGAGQAVRLPRGEPRDHGAPEAGGRRDPGAGGRRARGGRGAGDVHPPEAGLARPVVGGNARRGRLPGEERLERAVGVRFRVLPARVRDGAPEPAAPGRAERAARLGAGGGEGGLRGAHDRTAASTPGGPRRVGAGPPSGVRRPHGRPPDGRARLRRAGPLGPGDGGYGGEVPRKATHESRGRCSS